MHQIRFRLGLRPRPRWRSLQRFPRSPSCIKGALLLRGGERKERQRKGERKRRGREKGRGREGVAQGPAHARAGSDDKVLMASIVTCKKCKLAPFNLYHPVKDDTEKPESGLTSLHINL